MITVKVTNINLNGRSNQNTSFFFSEREYGFGKDESPSEKWVLDNLEKIKSNIKKQSNTKVQIVNK